MVTIDNQTVLVFTLRVILGILLFFQGYDKVFNIKMNGVIDVFKSELGQIKLPDFLLRITAYYTSIVELLCGGLLILGLFTQYSLYLISIDLILVVGAFSLIKPMWNMELVFPRLILLCILLYLPSEWNLISLDNFLNLLR